MRTQTCLAAFGVSVVLGSCLAMAQPPAPPAPQAQQPISFFVTSVGKGDGANLGGLAGADAHCQALAAAAGAGNRQWHAYLSASAAGTQPAVNARDRICHGALYNGKAATPSAQNVAALH